MAPLIIDKEEKKRQILKAALAVFSRSGYHESTIAAIAREAGIGKGTVYEYFKDKETLFMELFSFLIEDHLQYLGIGKPESIAPAKRLEEIILGTFHALGSMGHIYNIFLDLKTRCVNKTDDTFYHEQFARLYREFRRELAAIIHAGQQRGFFRALHPDIAATLIIAVMEGIMNQWIADQNAFDMERIHDEVCTMIMAYLRSPHDSNEPHA
ncbi:MAG: TetR/AcrR family transcriptional regulator [Desulfobacterota bacterium]|nr:TetR/AcrR family transcriptional regulator [Thermodesulfobacteriota bacterium]